MKLLAIDIGNTSSKWGLFDDDQPITSWQLESISGRSADEYWQLTQLNCREAGFDARKIEAAAVSTVVPQIGDVINEMTSAHYGFQPFEISSASCPFVCIDYEDPILLGADRICNGYAGYHHYGGPLIIVDLGTAVKIDLVDKDGVFRGGVIMPGPVMAARALRIHTAQLPEIEPTFQKSVIGKSPERCINSGLTWGIIDMIEGLIGRIESNQTSDKGIAVISTGGYADLYALHSQRLRRVHRLLTLEGVRLIFSKAVGLFD